LFPLIQETVEVQALPVMAHSERPRLDQMRNVRAARAAAVSSLMVLCSLEPELLSSDSHLGKGRAAAKQIALQC